MVKNPGVKFSAAKHKRLAIDLRSNPGNSQCLVKLVRSHFRVGNFQNAALLLKNIILNSEFATYSPQFQTTAKHLATLAMRRLINNELKAGRIQQAHKLYDRLAKLTLSQSKNHNRVLTDSVTIPNNPSNNTNINEFNPIQNVDTNTSQLEPDKYSASDRLADSLLERNWLTDAIRVLGNRNTHISYPIGVKIMQRVATSQSLRNDPNIKKYVNLLRELLDILEINQDTETIVTKSIFSNILYPLSPWREKILSKYELEEMKQWIELTGSEILESAYKEGNGIVLLNSHISTGRLAIMLLNRMGYKLNSIEARKNLEIFGVPAAQGIRVLELGEAANFPLRELYLAKNALEKGEIVNIAGDGLKGTEGIYAKFIDRTRDFKNGFPNLAIMNNAAVLPVFGSVHLSGKINIEIKAPLDKGDKKMPDKERLKLLVAQYAEMLADEWRKNPGDIKWEHIENFLSLPKEKN